MRGRPSRQAKGRNSAIIEISTSEEELEEKEEQVAPRRRGRSAQIKQETPGKNEKIETPVRKRSRPGKTKQENISKLEIQSSPPTKRQRKTVVASDQSDIDDVSWKNAPKQSTARGKKKVIPVAKKKRSVQTLSDSESEFNASSDEELSENESETPLVPSSDSEDDKPIKPKSAKTNAKVNAKVKKEPAPVRRPKAPKKKEPKENVHPDDMPRPENTEPPEDDPTYPLYRITYATSGRARCKTCDKALVKDELAIQVTLEHSRFGMNTYYKHVECSLLCDEIPIAGLAALSVNDEIRMKEFLAGNTKNGVDDERVALSEDHFIKRDIIPGKKPAPQLTATLLPYQQEGLAWMVNQEASTYRGGILADEMGMGKTIQAVSCMLEQVRLERNDPFHKDNNLMAGGTLIVCPVVACMQWRSEIERFVQKDHLKVHIHHGNKREKLPDKLAKYDVVLTTYSIIESEGRKILSADKEACAYCGKLFLPEKLVLHNKYICGPNAQKTSKQAKQQKGKAAQAKAKSFQNSDDEYSSEEDEKPIVVKKVAKKPVKKGSSPLHEIAWARIVLDEAHYIKDRRCSTARSVFRLTSKYKWCLTGTPLQNRIGELFSLIRFLQVIPFAYYNCTMCDCNQLDFQMSGGKCKICKHSPIQHYSAFNKRILNPIQGYGYVAEGKIAMLRLQNDLLRHILLRRTKQSRADDISLPPKLVVVRRDAMDEREKDFYESIYTQSKAQFNTYVSAGTLLNNYAHIFDLLIRLRQAVDHPYLVIYSNSNPALQLPTPEVPAKEDLPLSVDVAKEREEEVICGFCHEPAEDTVASKCSHSFCKSCVEEYLTSLLLNAKALCPSCEEPLTVNLAEDTPPEEIVEVASPRSVEQPLPKLRGKRSLLSKLPNLGDFQSSTKIEALMEEIDRMKQSDPSAKAIVFSQFVNMLDLIEHRLQLANIRCVKLSGNMPMAMRDKLLTLFRDEPKLTIFLISLKAGGVALNLTVASHIFLMDPWWNPAAEHQAIDRTHRLGQFKPIRATRFVIANTIEDRILKLQEKKQLVFEGTVGSSTAALGRLSEKTSQNTLNWYRKATFTVRDGYHLLDVNQQHSCDVDRTCFPELLRCNDEFEPKSVEMSSEVRQPETTTLTDSSPLEAWLIFRDRLSKSNQEPQVSCPRPRPPRNYEKPLNHSRTIKLKPTSQIRILPTLQTTRTNLMTPSTLPEPKAQEAVKLYETENSRWRAKTTLPVQANECRKLSARIAQFMQTPQILEHIEQLEQERKQMHKAAYKEDLVSKNMQAVIKPARPKQLDDKIEAQRLRKEGQLKRYAFHQEFARRTTEAKVDRWGERRRQEEAKRMRQTISKKALLALFLVLSAEAWGSRFKMVQPTIKMGQMVHATKKIQTFWRTKKCFSLNSVALAVYTIQQFILRWINPYREHMKRRAIQIIITCCNECQDAKFRRAIIKYRHYVTQFQALWRSWSAITDARIKLLLLYWNKIDRKLHGATYEGREKTPELLEAMGRIGQRRNNMLIPRLGHISTLGTKKVIHAVKLVENISVLTALAEEEAKARSRIALRVPHLTKITLLKGLLSAKRSEFLQEREQMRIAWEADREERRRRGFGMDVSSVLMFDSLRYGKSQFMLLKRIKELDMIELITRAEQEQKSRQYESSDHPHTS
ncbi:DNA repair protein [Thraustotheca clavata]|uniref:DNA repair protein n=1 Tax=Thraustotheca clavata TaxID=74557 RepID=A0A1V9Z6J7_9STRA|nr:DNA repair protein [Thraustotheca clavata]